MKRHRVYSAYRAAQMCVLLLCLPMAQAACALGPRPNVHIGGKVLGESVASSTQGAPTTVAVAAATVICNGVSTRAAQDGSYTLSVAAADSYQCTASAPPDYDSEVAQVPGNQQRLVLNFGVSPVQGCSWSAGATSIDCPPLHLRTGSLAGTISYGGGQPAPNVTVKCWDPAASPPPGTTTPPLLSATTDGDGAYTFSQLAPGGYTCIAGNDVSLHNVAVKPASNAALSFQVCSSACPQVGYHGGPVMHTYTAYLIFWLPGGYSFDRTGSPSRFESILASYFNDVGGTRFYDIATQYWDYFGSVENSVALGGTYVDTRPYGHAATQDDPLTSHDLKDEVQNAIAANHWTAGLTHEFFVFTGYGAEVCTDQQHTACSFLVSVATFCGYHDYVPGPTDVVYAVIPDSPTCVDSGYATQFGSPNGDRIADFEVNVVSHEQFESASDPDDLGWYTDGWFAGEIGDLCAWNFGTVGADGGNVTLGHGHRYLLQGEWSDQIDGCAWQA
jgi:hypothetical protein